MTTDWLRQEVTCAGCHLPINAGDPRIAAWEAFGDSDPLPEAPSKSWHDFDCIAQDRDS